MSYPILAFSSELKSVRVIFLGITILGVGFLVFDFLLFEQLDILDLTIKYE